MAWGPPGLAAWCRRHPESERHNFPITPRDRLELLRRLFTGEQTFSPLCVCASVCYRQLANIAVLCYANARLPGLPLSAAQTIWINLFFYVSHTGTTVAACRWAASSRSWVYAAEQLHFFTSAITVFQEILSWQSFKYTNNVLKRNPLVSRREILFWLRREILFWLLTALVGGAAHCGWLWILWCPDRLRD